jgi:hypothetical protein
MAIPQYTLSSILPSVRQSLREVSNFPYDNFVVTVWTELEKIGAPGITKIPPERSYTLQKYDYSHAPYELRLATGEAFHYLLRNGFSIPEPPQDLPANPHHQVRYVLTQRGIAWAASIDPLPEDVRGYMNLLHKLVPNLDTVIDQYIRESLSSFERQTFFAAAVMVGAASEKAIYLLAESMVGAFADVNKQDKLKKLMDRRRLSDLFHAVEKTIHDAHQSKSLPYPLFDGAVSHLMSLIEGIRAQRNDAVHPMNATVSADSVRLSLYAFPHALEKLQLLREWFLANPGSI